MAAYCSSRASMISTGNLLSSVFLGVQSWSFGFTRTEKHDIPESRQPSRIGGGEVDHGAFENTLPTISTGDIL